MFQVNDEPVANMPTSEVIDLLRIVRGSITLHICRRVEENSGAGLDLNTNDNITGDSTSNSITANTPVHNTTEQHTHQTPKSQPQPLTVMTTFTPDGAES